MCTKIADIAQEADRQSKRRGYIYNKLSALQLVRTGGLEPPRGYPRQILSLLRLPVPPRPQSARQ